MSDSKIDTEVTISLDPETGRLKFLCEQGVQPLDMADVGLLLTAISGVHDQVLAIASGKENTMTTVIELDEEDKNSVAELRHREGWYMYTIKVGSRGLPMHSSLMFIKGFEKFYVSAI